MIEVKTMVRNIVMPLNMNVYLSGVFNKSLEAKVLIWPSSSLCPLILCVVTVFYSCLSFIMSSLSCSFSAY